MSESGPDSRAWLEDLSRALSSELGEREIDQRILAFARSIDARYRANYTVEPGDRIPVEVFKRLIERLAAVIASVASIGLYRALRGVGNEIFGGRSLVEATRTALLARLDQQLAAVPGDRDARIARGELALDARDARRAAQDFAAVLADDETSLPARHGEIRALLAARRDDTALARLDEALRRDPDDRFALHERAQLLLRHSYVFQALTDIVHLSTISEDPETCAWIAQQLLHAGRPAEASALGRRLPPSADGLVILGKALLDLGELAGAIASFEQAVALVRGHESIERLAAIKVDALTQLGNAHAQRGETAPAIGRYAEAMAMAGSTYELRRAVVKLAWDAQPAAPRPPPPADGGDAAAEARWIEPNMTARFVDGVPVEVASADLDLAPYLERLPWGDVVESLRLPAGSRDNREAFVRLFHLALPRLRHLEIEAEHFGFACLFRLVGAAFFPRLHGLSLERCDLDAPALELLAERVPRGLRELSVITANAQPKLSRPSGLARTLSRWQLPDLQTLQLADCGLATADVLALTEATLPALTWLSLAGNDLRGLDVARFLDSPMVRKLHSLHIDNTSAEPEIVRAILDRVDRLSLRSLHAQRAWAPDELVAITGHPAFRHIEQVELGVEDVPEEVWLSLVR